MMLSKVQNSERKKVNQENEEDKEERKYKVRDRRKT